MSTRNPTHGTKVTDSNAPQIEEGAGAIASDSLAAESDRSGGGFSENRDSEPQDVKGANSTFANTNTSGARQLDPATDAESRGDSSQESKPNGAGSTGDSDSYQNGDASGNAGTAPSYVNSQFVDTAKPKGANLTEGGFDSDDSKNASFTADIGSKNDPSLEAENKMFSKNADAGGDAGFPKQQGETGDNTYESLGGDTSA